MKARILEIEKVIFDGEISKVILPATDGEICLLPNHISIITPMKQGIMKVFKKNMDIPMTVEILGGICSFSENCAVFILQ